MLRTRASIKKMGKAHRCSKCNRFRKGHIGPCGVRCDMPDNDQDWESASDHTEVNGNEHVNDTVDNRREHGPLTRSKSSACVAENSASNEQFMMEIARQLGELTVNVATLMAAKSVSDKPACITSSASGSDVLPSSSTSRSEVPAAQSTVPPASPMEVENVSLMNGARVTKKLVRNAKAGEFVDLNELVPSNEPSSVMESSLDDATRNLIFKKKSIKKTIDNFLTWSLAWAGYEELILENNFALYKKCCAYRLFIQKQNALYSWSAVDQYDVRFRHNLSMTHSFEFQKMDTDLGFSVFNSLSVRPSQQGCFRCKSLLHHVKDCPFPETASEKASFKKSKGSSGFPNSASTGSYNSRGGSSFSRSKEVCFNFNSGRCSDPCPSGRLHVCSGCGGHEPMPRCKKCTSSQNFNVQPPQSNSMGPSYGQSSR
jgi:hypothetical protein